MILIAVNETFLVMLSASFFEVPLHFLLLEVIQAFQAKDNFLLQILTTAPKVLR